jgi:NitT/TauT family transport system substrate-binding protein
MLRSAWTASILGVVLLLGGCATSSPAVPSQTSAPAAAATPRPAAPTSAPTAAPAAPAPTSAAASGGQPAARAPLSQTSLNFAIPVSSGLQVLPQLAQDAGYFKDEGLDVTISQVAGSQPVIAALSNGTLDMANSDSPSVIQAHASGVPVVIVAVPVSKPIFDVVASADIKSPEDLKGKTIAVTTVCDSTCFQVSRALQAWGLDPNNDVQMLGLRDYPGMFAALTNNQVAAAPLAPPFNVQAQKLGYHSLADLSSLPIDYPTAVVQTTAAFAAAHPDTVQAFLRAYTRAIARYKADEAFTVEVYKRFLKSDDEDVIRQTWEYYQRLMRPDPSPNADGVKFVLDSLAEQGDQRFADLNPDDFIEPQFMQRVNAAGPITP